MATGAAKARATLKYSPELYTPYALESWPDSQMRKEYTRLRDIAQKRLKRLSQDPISGTSDVYKEFAGGFPTIKAMRGDRKALEQALADVARFVRSKGSTVGGARVKFKQKMKLGSIDTDDVPEDQYTAVSEWWEIVKASGVYYYPSDQLVMYWREKGGYNVSIDDLKKWQQGEVSYGKDWEYSDSSSSAYLRGGFGGGL
jgi:hypothetical protein